MTRTPLLHNDPPSGVAVLQVLRQLFPQFAQQGPRGGFMQQDAEELYSSLVNTLSQTLKEVGASVVAAGG